MRTTYVRRLISSFSRSSVLVLFKCLWLARQPVETEGLLDVFLDPGDQPRILGLLLADPGGEVGTEFREIPTVVQPAQLLQAVVVHIARRVVERVPEKMHVAALVSRLRQHLADRRPESGVVVGDHELDAIQTPRAGPTVNSAS